MKKVLAFFDFDGTMIKGNSLPRFLWHYSNPFTFIAKSIRLLPVLMKYAIGLIDDQSAKENVYVCFFAGTDQNEFIEKAGSFSTSVIPILVREKALQKLRWHQESYHDCILVSASIEDYILPWAKNTGFSKVLATKLKVDGGGCITGRFEGKNCKGAEKVLLTKEHCGDLTDYETYVYGDSRGDMELLEIADHPYYRSFEEEKPYTS